MSESIKLTPPPLLMKKRDYRLPALAAIVIGIGALGYFVDRIPSRGVDVQAVAEKKQLPKTNFENLEASSQETRRELSEYEAQPPIIDPKDTGGAEARKILSLASQQFKARKYDETLITLNEARSKVQQYPESYLLMARALEAKKDFVVARDFYNAALNRNPALADAHWGFATTSESLGDLESALGGMRSYLHTEPDPSPERLRINQARSAIWEWEAKLGRGEWGPTRGVPPGFLPEDLKRDDRGVGVKWPIVETKQPDGTMKSEIKTAEKVKIYPRP